MCFTHIFLLEDWSGYPDFCKDCKGDGGDDDDGKGGDDSSDDDDDDHVVDDAAWLRWISGGA